MGVGNFLRISLPLSHVFEYVTRIHEDEESFHTRFVHVGVFRRNLLKIKDILCNSNSMPSYPG